MYTPTLYCFLFFQQQTQPSNNTQHKSSSFIFNSPVLEEIQSSIFKNPKIFQFSKFVRMNKCWILGFEKKGFWENCCLCVLLLCCWSVVVLRDLRFDEFERFFFADDVFVCTLLFMMCCCCVVDDWSKN